MPVSGKPQVLALNFGRHLATGLCSELPTAVAVCTEACARILWTLYKTVHLKYASMPRIRGDVAITDITKYELVLSSPYRSRAGKHLPVERVHMATHLPGCLDCRTFPLPTSSSPSERQHPKACCAFSANTYICKLRCSFFRPHCPACPFHLILLPQSLPLALLQFLDPGPY